MAPVSRRRPEPSTSMLDTIANVIAEADGRALADDPARYRRMALAALKPLLRPTDAMIDAAHAAVWFDNYWAINSRADFRKAVRAMIKAAMAGDARRQDG